MSDKLHLLRCSPTEFTVLRELSAAETASYREALDHLREFDKSPAYLELVARNQAEFDQVVAVWASSAEELNKDQALRKHQEIEFNRRLVNYLSAARLLLDHYETRLKRRYGNGSAEAQRFKAECAASYDNHFAYRFLYRLRNFAQHFGMPVDHVHARSRLEDTDSSKTAYEASILIDVEDLLSRGGDLWGKIANELKNLGPLLEVHPYVATMTKELNRIVSRTQTIEKPKLTGAGQVMVTIMREAIGTNQTPGVARVEDNPPKTNLQFIQPPFRLMQWLGFDGFEHPL